MYSVIYRFVSLDYRLHLVFSVIIRLALVAYGDYHDQVSAVKYTDVDYKVFTDASRHVLNGGSPYDRHTYRYSPLVALCLLPNVTLHRSFGKVLFSFVDIVVAVLIRLIVTSGLEEFETYEREQRKDQRRSNDKVGAKKVFSIKYRKRSRWFRKKNSSHGEKTDRTVDVNSSVLAWLYNPLTIAVGTRGNCDSVAGCLVLATLYVLQCKRSYFLAGILHGLSVHFRVYPLIYSLSYFMFLSKFSFYTTEDRRKRINCIEQTVRVKQSGTIENVLVETSSLGGHTVVKCNANQNRTIFKKEYFLYLVPNMDQLRLITGCLLSLTLLTLIFYKFYGYNFLYESYIYHVVRKDTRHNFSLYFYLQYLTAWVKNIGVWQKVLMVLPQLVLIVVFSVRYGLNKFSLNFSVLAQTVVMVIYNSVLTSQYFVWVMAVLPLCLWQIKMPVKGVMLLLVIWFAAQGAWLLPAYLLEFHGQNTFLFVWIQSVSLFCANIAILGRLIMYFMPIKEKL